MLSASHTAVDAGSAGDTPAATRLHLSYGRGKQAADFMHRKRLMMMGKKDLSCFETRSLPALARCFPRSFTFYVADPIQLHCVDPR